MAHAQDDSADGLPARREAREEKDRIKAEFGSRLRVLLDLTGLSSREFAQRFPAYKDSTVRKYTLGTNLPPWDFLHDLLTEVARRTDDPAAPHRRTELFTAYRQVLIDTGADIRGSDQNSLLLRLLDGEEALRLLGEELAEVRARENQLRTDLEEESRRAEASPSTISQDRKRQLEEESRALAERRGELVHRRGALITELDGCRTRLAVMEEAEGPGDLVPAGAGGGAGVHQAWAPPPPSGPPEISPPPRRPRGRRTAALIGGAVAVVLLAGGGAAVGIWATGSHDTTDQAASPSTAPSASTPTVSSSPDPASSSAAAGTEAPDSEDVPSPSTSEPSSRSGTGSLVDDLPVFEDGGLLAGAQRVNLREYPTALRSPSSGSCEIISTWQLDRTYKSLVTRIGLSDDSGTSSSAFFTISVDDRVAFQRTMHVGEEAHKATVKLKGVFRVTLTVKTCFENSIGVWIDPVVTK